MSSNNSFFYSLISFIKNSVSGSKNLNRGRTNKMDCRTCQDSLTGLPNRVSLMEDLSSGYFVKPGYKTIVIAADISHYNLIIDSMGSSFGEALLKAASARLRRIIGDGKLYRLDGNEFVILLKSHQDCDVSKRIDAITGSIRKPFKAGNSKMHLSMNMGVAFWPDNGNDLRETLKCAYIALNEARKKGRNNCLVYKDSMEEAAKKRLLIEECLHKALKKHEFELYYQPQMLINSGEITGFEALIRWNSPELGFVYPNSFIGIAEETGLIIPIGEWVLKTACRFIKRLHMKGHKELTISINVSIVQLMQDGFADTVLKVLREADLRPEYLELEITESIFVESYDTIEKTVIRLRELGIKVALDDFGRGYSSLSVLSRLPIHTLKIDKLFLDNLPADRPKQIIADIVIQIGNKLGLAVLAEGVETKGQAEYLMRYGGLKAQGYYFSRPIPHKEAENLITKGSRKKSMQILRASSAFLTP